MESSLTLRTIDGFEVPNCGILAEYSSVVRELAGSPGEDVTAPIAIAHYTLKLILSWCHLHSADPTPRDYLYEPLPAWFVQLIDVSRPGVDSEALRTTTIFELVNVAHHLQIAEMTRMCCKTISEIIKAHTPAELEVRMRTPKKVADYARANADAEAICLHVGVLLADITSPEFVDRAALDAALGDFELGI